MILLNKAIPPLFKENITELMRRYRTQQKAPIHQASLWETQEKIVYTMRKFHGVSFDCSPYNPLIFMENVCLALFFVGYRVKQVADLLALTRGTVDTYERRIREKLEARNRQEACYQALTRRYLWYVD
jgi:DNA-binding CsgD family transcriptional regulator